MEFLPHFLLGFWYNHQEFSLFFVCAEIQNWTKLKFFVFIWGWFVNFFPGVKHAEEKNYTEIPVFAGYEPILESLDSKKIDRTSNSKEEKNFS